MNFFSSLALDSSSFMYLSTARLWTSCIFLGLGDSYAAPLVVSAISSSILDLNSYSSLRIYGLTFFFYFLGLYTGLDDLLLDGYVLYYLA